MGTFNLALTALVVALVAIAIWLLAKRLSEGNQRAFDLLRLLAWIITVLLLVVGAVGLALNLASPSVTMDVPYSNVWPMPMPGVTIESSGASIEGSTTAVAQLTLSGLSPAPRILWAIGQLLSVLLPASVAFLVARAAGQMKAGAPFAPVLVRTIQICAVVILGAGVLGPLLTDVAGSVASNEALVFGASMTGYPDTWTVQDALPQPAVLVTLDLWPIGVAVALFVLSAAFRYGARLQKETEGLV